MLGTSMPLVMQFAKQHGMNALMLGLLWTFSAGGKLFAYQSGVLVLGYSYGYFEARDLVRIGALLTLADFFHPAAARPVLLAVDRDLLRQDGGHELCG
jgi:di/tricarboxylate transporter